MASSRFIFELIRESISAQYTDTLFVNNTNSSQPINDSVCYPLTEDFAPRMLYLELEEVITSVVLPIILVLGLSTNMSFLYVVGKVRSMRTVTNAYLVNLAVGDMLFLIVVISDKLWSFYTSELYSDHSSRSTFSCIALNVLNYTTLFTCEFLLTAVAAERYYAICHPYRSARLDRRHLSRNIIVSIWIISACLGLTMTPAFCKLTSYCLIWPDDEKYDYLPTEWAACSYVHIIARIYGDMLRAIPFFVVLIVNVVLYSLIIKELTNKSKDECETQAKTSRIIRNQVAMMLIVNTTVFFALMSPFNVMSVIMMFDSHRTKRLLTPEGRRICILFTRLLSYCNSVVNPLIYKAMNARYRKAFVIAFGCSKENHEAADVTEKTNTSTAFTS
ncbi:thyrotropin-releasing hormone receptor-like [Anneissia japonica]|uniref:thyrotropin-releasing hormone receptor-like n=1 Tax=Anneissia japonica TaxID=1529436 RepID=UPI0014256F14|nr:thyrotropin-releasing hormone receptor-like [Anneissia japonica]